jgi:hypothetical protein
MRRRQLHLWISDDDHEFLVRHAEDRDETVGMIVRRLIRQLKRAAALDPLEADPGAVISSEHPQGYRHR